MAVAHTKPRRNAVQERSVATVERILDSAIALIAEKGAEPVTMTEIARKADVVIGALYQYFDDKPAILKAILAKHNADVERMLRKGLEGIEDLNSLVEATQAVAKWYFDHHRTDPIFRGVASAVQTDKVLQALDAEDSLAKARAFYEIARPLYRRVDETELMATSALLMQLALAAARFALFVPKPLSKRMLSVYQRMCRTLLLGLEEEPWESSPNP